MLNTTVYLPEDLKLELKAVAAETGMSEADLIRAGIRHIINQRHRVPTIPVLISDDEHFAERVDEHLVGFGER